MGNDPNKYIHYNIGQKHFEEVFKNDNASKNLEYLYQQCSQGIGYITKEKFNYILGIDDDKIFEKIYNIFHKNNNKIVYDDIIRLYISFKNKSLKHILLPFLILEKSEKVVKTDYINKLAEFLKIDKKFEILQKKEVIEFIKIKNDNFPSIYPDSKFFSIKSNDQPNVYKSQLISYLSTQIEGKKFVKEISFYEGIKPSSKIYEKKRQNEKHYICDCLEDNSNLNKTDPLSKIDQSFLLDKLSPNGHLSFSNFEKMMKEYQVNNKLIELIKKYLESYTMKDSINLNGFKDLISNVYDLTKLGKKKDFLFEMISTIYNQKNAIKANQLNEILKIENKECKLEKDIDKTTFEKMEDPIINSEINKYVGYMENLGFLAYIRYNLDTKDQGLQKKIIKFILKERTAEQYLIDNFDKCDKFYPVNIEFWNSLIDNTDSSEKTELKINNSLIADRDEIYYIIKKEENKKKEGEDKNKEIKIAEKSKQNKIENNKTNKNAKKENNEIKDERTALKEKKGKKDNEEIKGKEKVKQKEEMETKEKEEAKEIKQKKEPIKGKLKNNVKYGDNYVILCDDIYKKVSLYYEFDYLIELEKTTIYYEPTIKEEKKPEDGKTKEAIKEEKKAEDDQNKYTIKEEKEKKEEVEEKLEINKENNFLRKKENKNKNIKEYIVDFYPIKILNLQFSSLINIIKPIYKKEEEKNREDKLSKMTKEEKTKFQKNENKEKKRKETRISEYNKQYEMLNELLNQKLLDKKLAYDKLIILNDRYKDLDERRNTFKVPMSEFLKILNDESNNILIDNMHLIKKFSKTITTQEIKYYLINVPKSNLNLNNFDIIYYTLEKTQKKLFPSQEKTNLTDVNKDFVLIITDTLNEEGKTGLSILEENEKRYNQKQDIKVPESSSKTQPIITDEELKKLKEEKNARDKAEKEKEKIAKEKLEKQEKERRKAQEKITHPPYGIPNFGNTCYFNSVNQIILNLPIMQKLFTNKYIKYMINKENKFGYKGKLVSSFIPLYELYPYEIEDYASSLKSLVGKLNETFNNKQQQDAHEYLNFVLEGLHEDLNVKSSKIYIEDNDDNYKTNTVEELGNIAWANNLRRNASFIDSIFMFQLKSNLTCRKCKTTKVNFETSYVFNLPLSLCKMVTVQLYLFRLPFKYKVYYDKINKNFEEFKNKEDNKNKKITDILCEYYSEKLSFEEKKEQAVYISLEFDIEREKSISDMIKLLRNIPLLELEQEKLENSIDEEKIKENKIEHYTEFIVYTYDKKKIIKNDTIIDKFVDMNDRVYFSAYETLNTNGFCLVNGKYLNKSKFNIYSYSINKKGIKTIDDFKTKIKKSNYFTDSNKEVKKAKESKEKEETKENKEIKNSKKKNEFKGMDKKKETEGKKETKNIKESKENTEIKVTEESKELEKTKVTGENKESIKTEEPKEINEIKASEESKEPEKTKDPVENKEPTKTEEPEEPNKTNEIKVLKESTQSEETQESLSTKEDKGIKETKDAKEIKENKKFIEDTESQKNKQSLVDKDHKETNKPNKNEINITPQGSIQNNNEQSNNKEINILSLRDKISYIDSFKDETKPNKQFDNITYEYQIPIVHYRRDKGDHWQFIFQEFTYSEMREFPTQFLILNNSPSSKISSRELYNYIWDYNTLFMIHPNKKTDNFWFNIGKDNLNYKKCYPFVIRIVKQNKKFLLPFKCSKCHWFNFCIGCVLSPDEEDLKFEFDDVIFVDWCNGLVNEEIDPQNFYCKKFSNEDVKLSIESSAKNDKNNQYQSITDCFNLFFEKENLEDPLSCRKCGGPQNFTKNYEINKLPYVLILSLKRFKYNENNNFKLRQLITYPLDNYKIKDKTYNLFGVVYHYGGINSGHYTCAVRKDKKWILCDDNKVYEIEEKRVMTSNAYILVYISDDSINTYSYYNCMRSLLQHIINDKSKKSNSSKNNDFFQGEPVRSKSKGNGYVVEDYIEDFIFEEKTKDSKDKNTTTENENKTREETKTNINVKKDGKVKVKFESKNSVEIVDKNEIEKLILVDEQKKDK